MFYNYNGDILGATCQPKTIVRYNFGVFRRCGEFKHNNYIEDIVVT